MTSAAFILDLRRYAREIRRHGTASICWCCRCPYKLRLLGVLAYEAPLITALLLVLGGFAPASLSLLLASLLIVGGALVAAVLPGWQTRRRGLCRRAPGQK
jgi:hypothetical protein